ncbi:MAG TPA: tetratricopeptide repeat protein [Geothrix sp.]|nr:tetratricopeptide repeat protein [Geothrix sp.]
MIRFHPLTFRLGLLAPVASILLAAPGGDISIFQRYRALDHRLDEATRAVDARQFPEARRVLEACLKEIPDHYEAHFLLARMAYEGRDFAKALAHVEQAEHSLADLDRRYRKEMAELVAQDAAEEQSTQDSLNELGSRGVDPTACSAILHLVKGSHLAYLEMKKGHLFERQNPFDIPADYEFLRGNCLYRLGRRDEALGPYRQAVKQDPTHANAWTNLIALLLEIRDVPQARAELALAEAAHVTLRPDLRKAVLEATVPSLSAGLTPR